MPKKNRGNGKRRTTKNNGRRRNRRSSESSTNWLRRLPESKLLAIADMWNIPIDNKKNKASIIRSIEGAIKFTLTRDDIVNLRAFLDKNHARDIIKMEVSSLIEQPIRKSETDTRSYLNEFTFVKPMTGGLSGDVVYKVRSKTTKQLSLIKLFRSPNNVLKECKLQNINAMISPVIYDCFLTVPFVFRDKIVVHGVIHMEYLNGYTTIHDTLRVSTTDKRQICKLIRHMHHNGVIHTDLHAKNIMTNGQDFKIIDNILV